METVAIIWRRSDSSIFKTVAVAREQTYRQTDRHTDRHTDRKSQNIMKKMYLVPKSQIVGHSKYDV